MLSRSVFFAMVIVLFAIVGCSGGQIDPTTPQTKSNGNSDQIPVVNLTETDGIYNSIGLMGSYELYLDIDKMTVELNPKRYSSIGEDFIVSALFHWQILPCGNCLRITGMMPEDGLYKVIFEAKHPFAPGDPGLPPSGKNRLDLDVFDLALVIAPLSGTPRTYSQTGTDVYTDICGKPDGYTKELAIAAGSQAAMPFFLVKDDSISGVKKNNLFPMGEGYNAFNVYFNEGGMFELYLTMGYGSSAVLATRFTPKYFIPEFNRKAAWKVDVIPPNEDDPPTMLNTWNNLVTDEEFPVTVEVYDWQIGATVTPNQSTYATGPTDHVWAASEVESVTLEIPGMYSTIKTKTSADSGNGMPNNPLVYTFQVMNENGIDPGTYIGLVKVLDERPPLPVTQNRDFLVHNDDGVLVYYTMPEYATYQTFDAVVVQGCGPITGSIITPATCPVTGVYDDASIGFEASASSANGGDPIVLYEWDMDYDGTTFDVDGTGESVVLGPFDNPTCGTPDEEPVTYTVAVRATDSCTPPNVSVLGTCDIVVEICEAAPINSIGFYPIEPGDIWFDICVRANGYVYVVADHPATGNTGGSPLLDGKRTALRFANNLSAMEVMNSGTGMADPFPSWTQFPDDWNRIDVSAGGNLVTNLGHCAVCSWTVTGTTASPENAGYIWCGSSGGHSICADVTAFNSSGYGSCYFGYGERSDNCPLFDPLEDWSYGFADSDPGTVIGYNVSPTTQYDLKTEQVKGIEGLNTTNNCLVFVTAAGVGKLAVVGDLWDQGDDFVEISTHGSPGTGDGEFTGGLDVSIDSNGNIVTLEEYAPGTYRFQKFNSSFVWQYTSPWTEAGAPMRIDFDTADNQLYVLASTGIHIMQVQ